MREGSGWNEMNGQQRSWGSCEIGIGFSIAMVVQGLVIEHVFWGLDVAFSGGKAELVWLSRGKRKRL